jgi:hypothetical protein
LQHPRLSAKGLYFTLNGFGLGTPAAAMQHDVIARLRQAQGDGAANATAGTGDQD